MHWQVAILKTQQGVSCEVVLHYYKDSIKEVDSRANVIYNPVHPFQQSVARHSTALLDRPVSSSD